MFLWLMALCFVTYLPSLHVISHAFSLRGKGIEPEISGMIIIRIEKSVPGAIFMLSFDSVRAVTLIKSQAGAFQLMASCGL